MKKMIFRSFSQKRIQTVGIILLTLLWMFVSSISVNLYFTNNNFKKSYFNDTNVEDFEFIPASDADTDVLAKKYEFSYEIRYIKDINDNGNKIRMISAPKNIDTPFITEETMIVLRFKFSGTMEKTLNDFREL